MGAEKGVGKKKLDGSAKRSAEPSAQMRIEMHAIEPVRLQEFAFKNHLVMEVHERGGRDIQNRFYAHFKNCEVSEGRLLRGSFGNGATPEEAMVAYIPEIEGRLLVIDAFGENRREIRAPGKLYLSGRPARKASRKGAK